jgi:hypothetical protein
MEPKQAARPEGPNGAVEENPRPSRPTESRVRRPSRLDGRLPFGLALALLTGLDWQTGRSARSASVTRESARNR